MPNDKDLKPWNVKFRDAILIAGNMTAGHQGDNITIEKGGVLIDVPAAGTAPRFVTLVPFSNVKQVIFAAE